MMKIYTKYIEARSKDYYEREVANFLSQIIANGYNNFEISHSSCVKNHGGDIIKNCLIVYWKE